MDSGLRRPSLARAPATPVYLQHKVALCFLLGVCKAHNINISFQFINKECANRKMIKSVLSGCFLEASTGYKADNKRDVTCLHYKPYGAQ